MAAQMVYHSLASQNCPLPVSVLGAGRGAGGHSTTAADGDSDPSPGQSRAGWFRVRGDNGLETTPAFSTPPPRPPAPTHNLDQM